ELGDLVQRAARGLQDLGLKPGDRFALCLPNCPFFVVLYFAVLRVGGVVVPVNPLYTERELDHQLRDSGAKMIAVPDLKVIHDKVEKVAPAAGIERIVLVAMTAMLPRLQGLGFALFKRADHARVADPALHVTLRRLLANRAAPDPVPLTPDDVAVLQYTGGTTGTPKGAMLTHANLSANSAQTIRHAGHDPDQPERTLGILPLFHVFALTCVLNVTIDLGGEIVLLPRFEMDQLLATLRRKPCTMVFGVPTIFIAFNDLPDATVPDFRGLRVCTSGGAPLPLDVRQRFEARTGGRVTEGYGLTEASPIITCNPFAGLVKDNSCGLVYPGTVIEIRDPDNPHVILPRGARGEVCVRGPQVMKGYWQRPEDTAAVFVDGALRTGDIGYFDEDGYLFLVDRIKDVIICGGYNVYPRAIEDAAYQHPAVKEAIAIAIPDPYRGQSPKLFVAPREGMSVTAEELDAFLAERISKIEMPHEYEIRPSLPRTLVGKLSKKELVEEDRRKRSAP
ncbi:MAG TPA: long-chain fatty acid--CoA ligase, partial [Novosphingobium sp.]